MKSEPSAQWIGVREASARSGVSVRALQKRAARGSINARKVEADGVEVWEIDASDLGASNGANIPKVDAPKVAIDVASIKNVDASNGANMDASKVESGRTRPDLAARLLEQLETENKFLRATVEQLQRDGAETRAALREALKLAPKALPEASQTGAAAQNSQPAPKGSEIGSNRREQPLTIGDIADELERHLKTE